MCAGTGCSNNDLEICGLCGGPSFSGDEWSKRITPLDPDHLGELQVKLMGILRDKNTEVKLISDKIIILCTSRSMVRVKCLTEIRGLLDDIEELIALLERADNNELTNADLEYIDCL